MPSFFVFAALASLRLGSAAGAAAAIVPVGASTTLAGEAREMSEPDLAALPYAALGSPALSPSCRYSWPHTGGTPARDGRSDELGPTSASLLWSGGRGSVIAWQPFTDGRRLFVVRQAAFPPERSRLVGGPLEDAPVVAMDLETGAELWAAHLPFETGDWTTWIAAAHHGLVFATRAGNGATSSARIYALRQGDGSVAWISSDDVVADAYDGVVVAPGGDLLVGDFHHLRRIRVSDGTTAWSAPRSCSVTDSCGAAIYGDAAYVVDAAPGGNALVRFDLATGARDYQSPTMAGFTTDSTPFVGPDGSLYLSRTENNAAVDFLFAFSDTGGEIVERWHRPAAWTTVPQFAVAADGSPYVFAPGYELVRLDPATGEETASAGTFADIAYAPRMAVDGNGTLFLVSGGTSDGRLRAFTGDLEPLWEAVVPSVNIGGPVIGLGGALAVSGIGTDLRVYRPVPSVSVCSVFADGFESGDTATWTSTVPLLAGRAGASLVAPGLPSSTDTWAKQALARRAAEPASQPGTSETSAAAANPGSRARA